MLMLLSIFILAVQARRWMGGLQATMRNVHRVLSPEAFHCERELGRNGDGRYPQGIAAAFERNAVRCSGRHRNLFCKCDQTHLERMVCEIFVRPGSEEERIVERKLDLRDPDGLPQRMRPFFTFFRRNAIQFSPILFEMAECHPEVIAEIFIIKSTSVDIGISRAESSPPRLETRWGTLSLSQCTAGSADTVCPITLEPFREHQLVHILKTDIPRAMQRQDVLCLSDEGLRQLALKSPDHTFKDPLKRTGERFLTIRKDYRAFIITTGADRPCDSMPHPSDPGPSNSNDPGPSFLTEPGPSSSNDPLPPRPNRPSPNFMGSPFNPAGHRWTQLRTQTSTENHFSIWQIFFITVLTIAFTFILLIRIHRQISAARNHLQVEFLQDFES